jgi:hypothetical protein
VFNHFSIKQKKQDDWLFPFPHVDQTWISGREELSRTHLLLRVILKQNDVGLTFCVKLLTLQHSIHPLLLVFGKTELKKKIKLFNSSRFIHTGLDPLAQQRSSKTGKLSLQRDLGNRYRNDDILARGLSEFSMDRIKNV